MRKYLILLVLLAQAPVLAVQKPAKDIDLLKAIQQLKLELKQRQKWIEDYRNLPKEPEKVIV